MTVSVITQLGSHHRVVISDMNNTVAIHGSLGALTEMATGLTAQIASDVISEGGAQNDRRSALRFLGDPEAGSVVPDRARLARPP